MDDLKKRLFVAMSSDLSVMAEHGDSPESLKEELETAGSGILEIYAETFL